MRVAGLEPARYRYRGILSPLCLPIPPHPHKLPAGTFQHVPQLKTRTFTCTALMSLSHILGTLVGEGGFEPPKLLAADLQSVPFGHSGIRPEFALISSDYNTTDYGKNQAFCEDLSVVYRSLFAGFICGYLLSMKVSAFQQIRLLYIRATAAATQTQADSAAPQTQAAPQSLHRKHRPEPV